MAAMMSRAFAFSPLAMVPVIAGADCAGVFGSVVAAIGPVVICGGLASLMLSAGACDGPVAGSSGIASKRLRWPRERFS